MSSTSLLNITKDIFKKRSYSVESIQDISLHIKKGNFQNILVVLGPEASSGSYSHELVDLQKCISGEPIDCCDEEGFTRKKFQRNPQLLYEKLQKIYQIQSDVKPSFSHFFLSQLQKAGILLRIYTLNVDDLEKVAGIYDEKIIYLNGTLKSSHCSNLQCRTKYDSNFVKTELQDNQIPKCLNCGNPVIPDIKFVDERIHYDHMKSFIRDANVCDLLIVVGTSLSCASTSDLICKASKDVCSSIATLYINTEEPKTDAKFSVRMIDNCDKTFQTLSMLLGWDDKIATLERNFYNKSLQN